MGLVGIEEMDSAVSWAPLAWGPRGSVYVGPVFKTARPASGLGASQEIGWPFQKSLYVSCL